MQYLISELCGANESDNKANSVFKDSIGSNLVTMVTKQSQSRFWFCQRKTIRMKPAKQNKEGQKRDFNRFYLS